MLDVKGKRVTVAGLGRFGGGIAAAKWLCAQGARVLVTDKQTPVQLNESLQQLEGLKFETCLGEHRESDFTDTDLVVASPAIPPTNPFLQAARNAGVPVTTEICLFVEQCPTQNVFGITGTKGKSTTTAMLGKILQSSVTTWVGGNIGISLLEDLPNIKPDHAVVLELSSYMLDYLDRISWSPRVAVITMLATDHGEWHGSHQAYLQAKLAILRHQKPGDTAILNEEDAASHDLISQAHARVILFGLTNRKVFELLNLGSHNQLNAQAAFAAASTMDVSWDDAQSALRDFPGLPHRLQFIHEDARGVKYYNDSIATIPEAAVAALESFPARKVIQIVGGSDKHLDLTTMCDALIDRAKAVLCIGEIGPQLAGQLSRPDHPAAPSVYNCGDLPTAIKIARQIASTGDVILLSPGTASYDQFIHFQARGELFCKLAKQ